MPVTTSDDTPQPPALWGPCSVLPRCVGTAGDKRKALPGAAGLAGRRPHATHILSGRLNPTGHWKIHSVLIFLKPYLWNNTRQSCCHCASDPKILDVDLK